MRLCTSMYYYCMCYSISPAHPLFLRLGERYCIVIYSPLILRAHQSPDPLISIKIFLQHPPLWILLGIIMFISLLELLWCFSFSVDLIGPWGVHVFGKTLLLVCLCKWFWMRLTSKLVDWSKQVAFPNRKTSFPMSQRKFLFWPDY